MPEYRYDIEQNTDTWLEIKLAMFSASSCTDLLMAKTTKGYQNLINRIAEEKITKSRCENNLFKGNWATDRGHEYEPIAREDYELRTLQVVKTVGVVIMDEWVLCSPDGLIGDNGLHQIKCPIFSTQKEYLTIYKKHHETLSHNDIMKKIDGGYYKQMQFELLVTGRERNVFTSFHPHLKPLDIVLTRDLGVITDIQSRLSQAINEVEQEIERIINL